MAKPLCAFAFRKLLERHVPGPVRGNHTNNQIFIHESIAGESADEAFIHMVKDAWREAKLLANMKRRQIALKWWY